MIILSVVSKYYLATLMIFYIPLPSIEENMYTHVKIKTALFHSKMLLFVISVQTATVMYVFYD